MTLAEIMDGFVYLTLNADPEESLEKIYQYYITLLVKKGIDPQYEHFLFVYHSAEIARSSSLEEQKALLKEIGVPGIISFIMK